MYIDEINSASLRVATKYLKLLGYDDDNNLWDDVRNVLYSVKERFNHVLDKHVKPNELHVSTLETYLIEYFKNASVVFEKKTSQKYTVGSTEYHQAMVRRHSDHPMSMQELEDRLFEAMLLIVPAERQIYKLIPYSGTIDFRMIFIAAQIYAHCGSLTKMDRQNLQVHKGITHPNGYETTKYLRDKLMNRMIAGLLLTFDTNSYSGYHFTVMQLFEYATVLSAKGYVEAEGQYEFFARLEENQQFRFKEGKATHIIANAVVLFALKYDADLVGHYIGTVFNLETLRYVYSPDVFPELYTDAITERYDHALSVIAEEFKQTIRQADETVMTTKNIANFVGNFK